MACMKEKIKNLFIFIGRAWGAGFHGKIGVIMVVIALFWSVGIFTGKTTLQGFIINIWRLNAAQEQLQQEQMKLAQLQKHINLVQKISEMEIKK